MRVATFLLLTAVTFGALAHEPPAITTVILVRHAEKAADPASKEDPPLTDAGRDRARELVRVLGATPIDAVYVTPYARTRQTAALLAEALKVQPIEIATGATYAADVAARIRREHRGGTVVVVGHSNSTQHVIRELGVTDAPAIADPEYDNLFIVTFAGGGEPRLLKLRYGAVAR